MSDEPLTNEQMETLRELLESLRDDLTQQVGGNDERAQPVKLDQQSVGRVSRMDAIQHQQMAKANLQQLQNRLRMVINALADIESGDYGYCRSCDEPIAFPRLQAKPETRLCLRCQSAMEQQ